jgi:hypothetical protein
MLARAFADFLRLLQPVEQQAAVGQPGERVVVGQLADFVLRLFALGDVVQGGALAQIAAVLAMDGAAGELTQRIAPSLRQMRKSRPVVCIVRRCRCNVLAGQPLRAVFRVDDGIQQRRIALEFGRPVAADFSADGVM